LSKKGSVGMKEISLMKLLFKRRRRSLDDWGQIAHQIANVDKDALEHELVELGENLEIQGKALQDAMDELTTIRSHIKDESASQKQIEQELRRVYIPPPPPKLKHI
jgi:predicted  nucleic acid-binding Zn-ribbon protein